MGNASDRESKGNVLHGNVEGLEYKPSNGAIVLRSRNPDVDVITHTLPPAAFQVKFYCYIEDNWLFLMLAQF
jgi:hypothetical protein